MATSKLTRDSAKKPSAEAKSRYYVLKTVQEVRTSLTGKLEAYNRKFVAQPLESGKSFVADLKAEPRKTVTNLMDDGKARVTDLNKEARTRIDGIKKEGHAFLTKAAKTPRETFSGLMDDGKSLVDDLRGSSRNKLEELIVDLKIVKEGVEKDTRLVWVDVINGSKKALDQVPGKRLIEKELSSRVEAIPAKFNLPSRKDIERLARQVKTLDTKVNKLSKAQAA